MNPYRKNFSQPELNYIEKLWPAIEDTSDHIIITDPKGLILFVNKGAENMTGYSKEEMLGRNPRLWGRQMSRDFYEKMWQTIRMAKKRFVGEVNNVRKNGERYVAKISITPILNDKDEIVYFVGTETDITREKELEKQRQDFISIVSHQLRTPLTGIKWVADNFANKEKLSPKGKEYIKDISLSVNKLMILVESLLKTSRLEEGKVGVSPEKVELVSFIKNFLDQCEPLFAEKDQKVIFTKHPEALNANTDKILIYNIIQSLVDNAVTYSPRSGNIEVALEDKNSSFLFWIKDNGIGIPETEKNLMFKKFMRATNARLAVPNGTGIGLYIVSEAVRLLEGKVWFESQKNKGATFYVELPKQSKVVAGERQLS